MQELDVKIVELKPCRVASVHGFGETPEIEAWEKLTAWAKQKDLLGTPHARTFGFNNPDPAPGSPNYGYELWLTVGPDVGNGANVTLKKMPGGLYAVTQFKGIENIGDVWRQLVVWRQGSRYEHGHHQWLEELLSEPESPPEQYVFNLYLPIRDSMNSAG